MIPSTIGFVFFTVVFFLPPSISTGSITVKQNLTAGQTVLSSDGVFELGFFSPGTSGKQYIGVWYQVSKNVVIWVANRESPVINLPGTLMLNASGTISIFDSKNNMVWCSTSSRPPRNEPKAYLLDSGNFIITDESADNIDGILWQGFDYPCDTQVPGMKIGRDLRNGRDVYQSSWKSVDDPAEGNITLKLDMLGIPQFFVRNGFKELFRSGPWNGLRFSGRPNLKPNPMYTFKYVSDENWIYYDYQPTIGSVLMRTVANLTGALERYIWNGRDSWNLYLTFQADNCDSYNWCGNNAKCNINNSPSCTCLKGYVPKSQKDWDIADWSSGCVLRTSLSCLNNGDGFVKHSDVKVPDTRNTWSNRSMTLQDCRMSCLMNCSCTAYASWDVRNGGSGCINWLGELRDVREYSGYGQEIFLKLPSSEVVRVSSSTDKQRRILIGSISSAGLFFTGLAIGLYVLYRKKRNRNKQETRERNSWSGYGSGDQKGDLDLPVYDFETVTRATNQFSLANKLGEGGFGPVYKGVLEGGQEVAVKRLSHDSKQGSEEFKNEVKFIAKLQHRNLVRLLGCCIQEEKILIYEYMRNKSLDGILFDAKRGAMLDWPKRFNIITGIVRGVLYLHQDSRLRVIHRDLKASNILLDDELNPKVSDFGMARCFRGDETAVNTTRVVGTYGYMPPEYAIDGIFSVKSDVFSFGVLLLEIVTGKRNRGFHHPDHHLNLLGHVWRTFKKGAYTELVDEALGDSCVPSQVLRSLHVGLLCVQRSPAERPTMSTVNLMLSSDTTLPAPMQPGFYTPRTTNDPDSSSSGVELLSGNEMTVTLLTAR
uniref:Receptor-like serine/threonine-protein kinase n=2 Tax=Kalanchoe fedtschenkoi TaxID=63787 RepID=A0A7N0SXT6_KALFE